MLTIERPIGLVSARGGITLGGGFAERIRSGYLMMQMDVAVQQLLYLLGAEDAPPPAQSFVTQAEVDARTTVNQQLAVELVNNVVNRILLSQSPSFTYRDNVFVTTVLEKLGVTNVSAFMRSVSALLAETRSMQSLVRLARQDINAFTQVVQNTARAAGTATAPEGEAETPAARAAYTLHNAIYNRLDTATVYGDVASWNQQVEQAGDVLNTTELALAEQQRVAAGLPLAGSPEGNTLWQLLNLVHHSGGTVFAQAAGDDGGRPRGEGGGLRAQLAAAGLASLADRVLQSRLVRHTESEHHWTQLAGPVQPLAQNAVFNTLYGGTVDVTHLHADATETETETLRQSVEQIEQRNREIHHRLETLRQQARRDAAAPARPDSANIMRDALSMLQGQPAAHLDALDARQAAELRHAQHEPVLEQILAGADERTREVYELLLRYQRDPQGALATGRLRQADAGVLNAEVERVVRQQAETVHRTTGHTHTSERITETVERAMQAAMPPVSPGGPAVPPPPGPPPPVARVHRRQAEDPAANDAPPSQPEVRRVTEVREGEVVNRQVESREVLEQINRQVAATTTEDIAELVNKTLRRELDTISDRVLSRMEKRLTSERMRRGW